MRHMKNLSAQICKRVHTVHKVMHIHKCSTHSNFDLGVCPIKEIKHTSIMAALAPTMHTYVTRETTNEERPAKKAKLEPQCPDNRVTGISLAIIKSGGDSEGDSQVYVFEGDRHFWIPEIKIPWTKLFWSPPPQNDKGVASSDDTEHISCNGAPHQIYTVQDSLTFLGVTYGPRDQAPYILKHMLSKKWVPKCCFPEKAQAEQALEKSFDVSTVETSHLDTLFSHLLDFTDRVKHIHYNELVMGGVEGGPTFVMRAVEDTLIKETYEEAGASIVSDIETVDGLVTAMHYDRGVIDGKISLVGFSDPFTSRKTGETVVTAMYVSTFVNSSLMDNIWSDADSERRPHGFKGWRCPHAWYKTIPGIDKEAAKQEKAMQETRLGRWVSIEDAQERELFMDDKNKRVLAKTLELIRE